MPGKQDPERTGAEQEIDRERAETVRLIGSLSAELDGIIESVSLSNNDDEHDPDGATSGYERAKATAMLQAAEDRLVELDRAAERVRAGTYGRCERCGGEIGHERLDALIATTRCRACAAERLRDGTYGRCARCGDAIAPERLEALIAATLCLPCATARSAQR